MKGLAAGLLSGSSLFFLAMILLAIWDHEIDIALLSLWFGIVTGLGALVIFREG